MTAARRPILGLVVAALTLVAACGGPPRPQAPAEASERSALVEHTIQAGDTLPRLAELYYGDPERAADIADANGVPVDARLTVGSVLRLPFAEDELATARRRQAALRPYNRGVDAMERGDLVAAERHFRAALATVGELEVARYNLALVLNGRGRHDEAAEILEALCAARPGDPDYGFALGNARFYQTRYAEAAAAFGRVLAEHPDHRRAAFGYARSLHETGPAADALAAWDAYLLLDDSSPWADEARRLRARLQSP